MADSNEVNEALATFKTATEAFKDAIVAYDKQVKLDTVGLDGWIEDIDDVMFDIEDELNNDEE